MKEVSALASCAVARQQVPAAEELGGWQRGPALAMGEDVLSLQPTGNTCAPWEPAEGMIYESLKSSSWLGRWWQAELTLNFSSLPYPNCSLHGSGDL